MTTTAAKTEAMYLMEILAGVDLSDLPWPESPRTQVMDALRFLLEGSLTERPKRGRANVADMKDLAWCFVAGPDFRPIPVRTFQTLEKKIAAGAVYFTPNTFFSRKGKSADRLRWPNTIYLDVDDPEICLLDVLERCTEVGLPVPTVVVKTPRGVHVYWKLSRVRATQRAVRCYTNLLRAVARAMAGDLSAATPERFMRLPNSLLYFSRYEYSLQDFITWHKTWDDAPPDTRSGQRIVTRDIMEQTAVKALLEGVEEGRRNNTAFSLALVLKASGYSQERALEVLTAWNFKNRPPLPVRELRTTVKSAFTGKYRRPSSSMLSYLSGEPFRYKVFKRKEAHAMTGKHRRGRPPVRAAVQEKFLKLLESVGGTLVTRDSRAKLARQLGTSPRTLDSVVAALVQQGMLSVSIRRLGKSRGCEVTYCLCHTQIQAQTESYNAANNRNTYGGMGRVGGGHPVEVVSLLEESKIGPAGDVKPNRAQGRPSFTKSRTDTSIATAPHCIMLHGSKVPKPEPFRRNRGPANPRDGPGVAIPVPASGPVPPAGRPVGCSTA